MGVLISQSLLEVLVCPVCHAGLSLGAGPGARDWLRCGGCSRFYPVEDGIPVLLESRSSFVAPAANESGLN